MTDKNSSEVAKATRWSFLTQLTAKVIPPLTSMILARLLSPEVFGIIATITMVTSFAETFSEAGFQKYIISTKYTDDTELEHDEDIAFWTHLGISLFALAVVAVFRAPLCRLLGNPGVEMGLVVSCFPLVISALTSIQTAAYYRTYSFVKPFWGQLISSVGNLIVTIVLALLGFDYWAIIIGNIAASVIRSVVLTIGAPWRPHFYFHVKRAVEIVRFSFWIMAEGISVWLTSWFDSFVVGNRLNSHDLGVYKNSQSVVNGLLSIPQNSITNVLLVTLSRQKDEPEEFNKTFLDAQKTLTYILLPMAAGICIFRELAVRVAFGAGWEDAEIVVGVWALASVLRVLFVSINTAVYVTKGKPKISLYLQLVDMAILIPTCIYGIRYGFEKFVLIRGIARLDIIIPSFIILSKMFGIRFRSIARNAVKPLMGTAVMSAVGILLKGIDKNLFWDFGSILICIVVYFTFMILFAREDLKMILKLVKR